MKQEYTDTRVKTVRRSSTKHQIDLTKRRKWFAETGDTSPPPATPSGETVVPANTPPPEATLPKSEADKLVEKARKDAHKEAKAALLEQLGISTLEDATTRFNKLSELEEAQLSESEKLQAKVAEMEAKALEAEKRVLEMQVAQRDAARRSAIISLLRESGAKDVDDLFIIIAAKHSEAITETFIGDSIVPEKGKGKDLIDLVQKEYNLYFQSAGAGSPSTQGGIPPTTQVEAELEAKKQIKRIHQF